MVLRRALLLSVLLISACGASTPSGAEAQDDPISEEDFDRMLRDALLRNPAVILEAIEAYRSGLEQEAALATRQAVSELMPELASGEAGHAIGASAEDAELIVIEFFDYHCGFCRNAVEDVLALVESDPAVRVVFQELPILRDESRSAAATAIAASGMPGADYGRVHSALMKTGGILDEEALERALKRAGLKPAAVVEARQANAEAIDATIDRSVEMARTIGINGTPFFIVANTKTGAIDLLEGYRPETFARLIADVRG